MKNANLLSPVYYTGCVPKPDSAQQFSIKLNKPTLLKHYLMYWSSFYINQGWNECLDYNDIVLYRLHRKNIRIKNQFNIKSISIS